jgi:hypothetical protein
MKNFGFLFGLTALFIMLFGSTSCDRVEIAYKDIPDLDSAFYPGVWGDYVLNVWPEFSQNTNTQRNVLIDKYTGHTCVPCVNAAVQVKNAAAADPTRIFYASLHAGVGGMTSFQEFNSQASSFYTDHTNSIALSYGAYFQTGFGFIGNPGITVNRELFGGSQSDMFKPASQLATRVAAILSDNDLKYNLQSVCNYYSETQGGYLHVEVEKIQQDNPEVDIIVYFIQDSLRDWQRLPGGIDDPEYLHLKKHLGNIDNLMWGQRLSFSETNKIYKDYSFAKPNGIEPENLHFLIFLCDAETKVVYQVIKQKLLG